MNAQLCDFVTENTYFFFHTILNPAKKQDFLRPDPAVWNQDENYIAADNIVKKLLVVNDIAEHGIALITRFNTVLTHQEKQKQYILHEMEKFYKKLPSENFSKKKFVEYLNKTYPTENIEN